MSGTDALKRCSKCGVEKPRTEFHTSSGRGDGFQYYCKPCQSQYRAQHPRRPVSTSRARAWHLKRAYGITSEQYDQMLVAQDGTCAICDGPPSGKSRHYHVDHCHTGGQVRGLLCSTCNVMLGSYEKLRDNPRVMAYLCQ